GAGGAQRGASAGRAVTVHAFDLDGVAYFAVELPVAVHVLLEVAVDAVHALLEMDVLQVDGHARLAEARALDRRGRVLGSRVAHDVVAGVEQPALAVVLEDGAEHPAVAVEVGELGERELVVQRRGALEERLARDVAGVAPLPRLEGRPEPRCDPRPPGAATP